MAVLVTEAHEHSSDVWSPDCPGFCGIAFSLATDAREGRKWPEPSQAKPILIPLTQSAYRVTCHPRPWLPGANSVKGGP